MLYMAASFAYVNIRRATICLTAIAILLIQMGLENGMTKESHSVLLCPVERRLVEIRGEQDFTLRPDT